MANTIYNPTLANVDEHSDSSATFTIEPLHTGYGNTLGNSIRRVLLSSIAGAAVVSFKIEGATHEFTTIDGVREDILEIGLNLKNVRVRVHAEGPVELRIEKKGAGAVTAGDIKASNDVEIVNPELVIANLDNDKISFNVDLVVESGRGYRTLEESGAERLHSDHIALDALFSPIRRVRYSVESTRVGQITNLDKLVLNIETDGSLSPRDAFEQAAAILINQYTALAGNTKVESAPSLGGGADSNRNDLQTSIEDLGLSARTTNALINNEIRTVHDLVTLSEQDLRELKGFGSKALDEVRDKIAELEL